MNEPSAEGRPVDPEDRDPGDRGAAATADAVSADPGRTTARRVLRRTAALAAATATAALVLAYFGTGGFRQGFLLSAAPLVAICGGGTLLALRRLAPAATTWALVGMVAGLLVAGAVVEVSPPSRGRLRAEADALRLPFYEVLATRSSGNSRCAPCPVVEREYRAPVPSIEGSAGAVVAALLERRLMSEVAAFDRTSRETTLRGQREDVTVTVVIRVPESGDREPLVTVRLQGRR